MSIFFDWRSLALGLLLTGAAGFAPASSAKQVPQAVTASQRPGHAAIASANFLATRAGLEVLRKGGNAFEAAVSWLYCIGPATAATCSSTPARRHRRQSIRRFT